MQSEVFNLNQYAMTPEGQRSRSHEAKDSFGDLAKTSFSTPLVWLAFLVLRCNINFKIQNGSRLSVGSVVGWSIDWLIDWLIDSFLDWWIHWLVVVRNSNVHNENEINANIAPQRKVTVIKTYKWILTSVATQSWMFHV